MTTATLIQSTSSHGDAAPRRPPMPLEFYRPSTAMTCLYIGYGVLLFFGPSLLSYDTMVSDYPTWRSVLTFALAIPASAFGALTLGFLGHDGTHLSLHRNRRLSMYLGIFFSAILPTYAEMGFAVQHWNHHRYCNQAGDPDIQTLARLKTWWQRLLLARITYNVTYARTLICVLARRPLPFKYKLPFDDASVRHFCWFNVASALFWVCVYAACAAYDVRLALALILPAVVGLLLSGAQSFIDHGGIQSDRMWENTRTRTSIWATLFWYGNNYHLEHHLYPGVPAYWLPRVHRRLRDQGLFARVNAQVDPHFWRPYASLWRPLAPSHMEQPEFDPSPEQLRGRYA